jgi:hypothetical protein
MGGGGWSRGRLLPVFAVLLGAGLLSAAPASARYVANVELAPPGKSTSFRSTSLWSYGGRVSIFSSGGPRRGLTAGYSGPGRTSLEGITGQLGRFGSVDLDFTPDGAPERTRRPKPCKGAPFRYSWKGTFRGSVRFAPDAGLEGVTIRDGRFDGEVATYPRWHCGSSEKGDSELPFDPNAGGVFVHADSCDGFGFDANVEVRPATPPSPDEAPTPVDFSAHWTKTIGEVEVLYSLEVEGGPETAVFGDGLASATLRPPKPFHGVAELARRADGSWEWTGTLSASFPGRTVSLVGPEVRTVVSTYEPRPNTGFVLLVYVPCRDPR